jgi:hypothetical protein
VPKISAPKENPNLVSTTMRSAEGSGAVIRHSNDTFQRGAYGQLCDRVWRIGLLVSIPSRCRPFLVCTHRTARIFQAWEAVASAACPPTRALQATGLPRLTEWMVWTREGIQ